MARRQRAVDEDRRRVRHESAELQIYGPDGRRASPQDMAMAMAMYPQMKPALDKMAAEGAKLQGTAILTDMVKPCRQALRISRRRAAAARGAEEEGSWRHARRPEEEWPSSRRRTGLKIEAAARHHHDDPVEMLKLTTDVDAASVAMPGGFTERKSVHSS